MFLGVSMISMVDLCRLGSFRTTVVPKRSEKMPFFCAFESREERVSHRITLAETAMSRRVLNTGNTLSGSVRAVLERHGLTGHDSYSRQFLGPLCTTNWPGPPNVCIFIGGQNREAKDTPKESKLLKTTSQ